MVMLQAIRYHVHRLVRAESGRQESDALEEMRAEDEALERRLVRLELLIDEVGNRLLPNWGEIRVRTDASLRERGL